MHMYMMHWAARKYLFKKKFIHKFGQAKKSSKVQSFARHIGRYARTIVPNQNTDTNREMIANQSGKVNSAYRHGLGLGFHVT